MKSAWLLHAILFKTASSYSHHFECKPYNTQDVKKNYLIVENVMWQIIRERGNRGWKWPTFAMQPVIEQMSVLLYDKNHQRPVLKCANMVSGYIEIDRQAI